MIDTQDVCPSLVLINLVYQQVDTARNQAIQLEKRAKNFDKVIAEWKQKLDELTAQLESSQKDYRWGIVFIWEIPLCIDARQRSGGRQV